MFTAPTAATATVSPERCPGVAGRLGLSREALRGIGIVVASYAIVWGAWVAWPTFDVFTTSPIYRHYRDYPEWLWGLYALCSGIAQVAGIRRHAPLLAFTSALLLVGFYLFGAWNFLLADSRSPGVPLLLLLMFWEVLIADSKARTAPNLVRSAAAFLAGFKKDPNPENGNKCHHGQNQIRGQGQSRNEGSTNADNG